MAVASLRSPFELVSLDDVPTVAWQLLTNGVQRASDPFHTPSIATIGREGPLQRTVVLRHVDPEQRLVACHTDRRSSKTRDVVDDRRCSWHIYDSKRNLQLRLGGTMNLHTDDSYADECWGSVSNRGKACYNTSVGPGLTVQRPPGSPSVIASEPEETDARSNFAVISCRVDFMDWLFLTRRGHRRAQIRWIDERIDARWVTP